ncbi:hypothetical protein CDD80_6074 [Ophiocordyceps camponoti-rufipedis]|uniref:ZZ-type domain-containing protein n=1 Tax=Ophiocordyceps camponoti-rufipedis TaxID=2004952 RepID=A0A2C5XFB6_9HYPO|nr:hypothetical protein CDD80_6074 [Ophiocordyceps camponoti-rufipedis]
MSSAAQTAGTSAAPVTVKILYEGATRRAKMSLREMVPKALEQHVRNSLQIPDDAKVVIERFSDSAAAYVLLDSANASIYKQLYRAAKAKGKLKLRVTVIGNGTPTAAGSDQAPLEPPRPVVPEASTTAKYLPAVPSFPSPCKQNAHLAAARRWQTEAAVAEHARWVADGLTTDPEQPNFNDSLGQLEERLRATTISTEKPCNYRDAFKTTLTPQCPVAGSNFAVCCNSCERTIPDSHFHCSTCDDGDFDLCQACVDHGISCYNNDHWLIRRVVKDGQLVNSTTETIPSRSIKPAPKLNLKDEVNNMLPPPPPHPAAHYLIPRSVSQTVGDYGSPRSPYVNTMRTCNCCVLELPERQFLHCTVCDDFDLCQRCFVRDNHGHHPKHGFVPAVDGALISDAIKAKMSPGRDQVHHAICDGCDKYITGIRYKCLDCPDWDYCSGCIDTAHYVHAEHRFVPVYEPLAMSRACAASQSVHSGVCCDGPLCSATTFPSYIRGVRYKCAVCHDLDFCASCEASPANTHNKTHPLIKFKTPVRHVSVTTTGEHQDGKRMPAMGDRNKTAPTTCVTDRNSINAVQTVVDVEPLEPPVPVIKPEAEVVDKSDESAKEMPLEYGVNLPWSGSTASEILAAEKDLRAVFVRDSVEDGTIMAPNHLFEQTWILRNEGTVAWPPGCSVRFVGGDYMGRVDSNHPACISELVSASESTICHVPLDPGQEFSFTVLLRTPPRSGKVISYWRLTTSYGHKFGHRLWCEVNVRPDTAEPRPQVSVVHIEDVKEHASQDASTESSSTMVFPKLVKESPEASLHDESPQQDKAEAETQSAKPDGEEGFEGCGEDDAWDGSDEDFLTDEEYDILDASDEEFLEQQKKAAKK